MMCISMAFNTAIAQQYSDEYLVCPLSGHVEKCIEIKTEYYRGTFGRQYHQDYDTSGNLTLEVERYLEGGFYGQTQNTYMQGKMLHQYVFDRDSILTSKNVFFYKNDLVVRVDHVLITLDDRRESRIEDEDFGAIRHMMQFKSPRTYDSLFYDEEGRLILKVSYDGMDHKLQEEWSYVYNTKGLKRKKSHIEYGNDTESWVYEYNENDQLERVDYYHGRLIEFTLFEYDAQNRLVNVKVKIPNGNNPQILKSWEYIYDGNNCIKKLWFGKEKEMLGTYELAYDSTGNWIEVKKFDGVGVLTMKWTREIWYRSNE